MRLPSEVLELGTRIVRELSIEKSNDTLGRWMAHHLAELIEKAESVEGDDGIETQEQIIDLILRVWSRRRNLPRGAYPLNSLEDVLLVVWRLRPEASPFLGMGSSKTEDLLADIFRRFQRVVVHGILLTSGVRSVPENLGDFEPFFDEDERDVIDNVNRWVEFFNADQRSTVRVTFGDSATTVPESSTDDQDSNREPDTQTTSKRLLRDEIDELNEALSMLRSRLTT